MSGGCRIERRARCAPELFARYQRGEKALVAAPTEMQVWGVSGAPGLN